MNDELLLFLKAVKIQREMYGWRLGQAVFNQASKDDRFKAAALALTGSEVDPFYDDSKVWEFLNQIGLAQ